MALVVRSAAARLARRHTVNMPEIIAALTEVGSAIPEVAPAIAEHRTAATSELLRAKSLNQL